MTDPQEVAKAVLGNIMLNPEQHDQTDYGRKDACGTTMCAAGWAVHLFKPEKVKWLGRIMVHADTNETGGIHSEAANLLGLNRAEANTVFMADNEDAIKHLMRLARGRSVKV